MWFHRGDVVARHARAFGPLLYDDHYLAPDIGTPTLEKLAAVAGRGVKLFLDLKSGGFEFCLRIVEVLRGYGLVGSTAVSSQDWQALELLESMEPSLPLYFSVQTGEQWQDYGRLCETRFVAGISAHHSWLTPDSIAALKGKGIQVHAWTVDDPGRAADLVDWGVDGLISNSLPILSAIGVRALTPQMQT